MTTEAPTEENVLADYNKMQAEVPEAIRKQLGSYRETYGVDGTTVKSVFAMKALMPQVAAQPNRWEVALRATGAELNKRALSRTYEYEFQPVGAPQKPSQTKVDPTNPSKPRGWNFRVSGIARCKDPKNVFEGPATLMGTQFGDERSATNASERFVPGHLYKVQGSSGNRQNAGKGFPPLFVNATEVPVEVPQPNGAAWPDPFAVMSRGASKVPMSELLTKKPEDYLPYVIEGSVVSSRRGIGKNGEWALITLMDDSVNGSLLSTFGGVTIFLNRADHPKAQLATGSSVIALVSGRERLEGTKDAQGNPTGRSPYSYNAITMKVLLDLGGGTEVSDPSKTVVTIPEGKPVERETSF